VSTDPSQGIYRVTDSRSARSVTLYSLKYRRRLTDSFACSFASIYLSSFFKETSYCRENPSDNIPINNVHQHTTGHH